VGCGKIWIFAHCWQINLHRMACMPRYAASAKLLLLVFANEAIRRANKLVKTTNILRFTDDVIRLFHLFETYTQHYLHL